MTHPIGYNATSDAAQLLEQRYGSYLERLTNQQRLLLVMVQAYAVLSGLDWLTAMGEIETSLLDLDEKDVQIFSLLKGIGGEFDYGISTAALDFVRFGPKSQIATVEG